MLRETVGVCFSPDLKHITADMSSFFMWPTSTEVHDAPFLQVPLLAFS